MFAARILILAPHPDDEVVGCCAAIGRARAAGARVFVLTLTTGVPERALLWPWQRPGHPLRVERRRAEAAAWSSAKKEAAERRLEIARPPSRPRAVSITRWPSLTQPAQPDWPYATCPSSPHGRWRRQSLRHQ